MARSNWERFSRAFDQLNTAVRKLSGSQGNMSVSFPEAISLVNKKSGLVAEYEERLITWSKLRNVIAHSGQKYAIAEPHPDAVAEIEKAARVFTNPPLVLPIFRKNNLLIAKFSDSIGPLLREMKKRKFSQVPVVDPDNSVGLLTSDTIARWLASALSTEASQLSETPVVEVQEHDEHWQTFEFIHQKATVFDAALRFQTASRSNAPLASIFITRDGKMRPSIKGIITNADLAKVPMLNPGQSDSASLRI